MTATIESLYLLSSNRKKCSEILAKPNRSDEDIMDFLVSLHLVLELGLNAFFRQIIMIQLQKGIEKTKIAGNLDRISFIDKAVLFIYMPSFDFNGQIEEADRYHSLIGTLRKFAEIRNKLLHGHMIARVHYSETHSVVTETSLLLNEDTLTKQITDFKFIMDGIAFYFDCLKSSFTPSGKASLKAEFLDKEFLNSI